MRLNFVHDARNQEGTASETTLEGAPSRLAAVFVCYHVHRLHRSTLQSHTGSIPTRLRIRGEAELIEERNFDIPRLQLRQVGQLHLQNVYRERLDEKTVGLKALCRVYHFTIPHGGHENEARIV